MFCLRKKLLLCLRRKMQNIFVFFRPETEIAALHATKVQQVRRTLNAFIHVIRERRGRETCYDDFISFGQLTAQLYTVIVIC
jgi:hypothetical protein